MHINPLRSLRGTRSSSPTASQYSSSSPSSSSSSFSFSNRATSLSIATSCINLHGYCGETRFRQEAQQTRSPSATTKPTVFKATMKGPSQPSSHPTQSPLPIPSYSGTATPTSTRRTSAATMEIPKSGMFNLNWTLQLAHTLILPLIQYATAFLTTIKMDDVLDHVIETTERNLIRYPFLMKYTFVRDLLKLRNRSDPVLRQRRYIQRERDESLVLSPARVRRVCHNDNSRIGNPVDNYDDDDRSHDTDSGWGHFADFDEADEDNEIDLSRLDVACIDSDDGMPLIPSLHTTRHSQKGPGPGQERHQPHNQQNFLNTVLEKENDGIAEKGELQIYCT